MSFMGRWVAVVVVGLVVVSGCTSGESPDSPQGAASVAAPDAPTPWSEAVEAFDPEGPPDVEAVLALFSLAFGPIAGAPAPPADTGASGSATVAVRAVLGVWDQLSQEQRDQIDAALTQPAESSETRVAGLVPLPRAAKPAAVLVDAITATARDFRAQYAAKVGDFPGKLTVVVATENNADEDFAYTQPAIRPDGTYTGDCTVTILPLGTGGGADLLINTIAHEMFHCFQLTAYGSNARWATAPKWVVEGGAEWAAATISRPDSTTAGRWRRWLTLPEAPLRLRSYPAIGFWSHLDESGTSPWEVFRKVWAVGGTPAAFETSGANTPAFLESWASGYIREPARGPAWDTDGPGITADKATPATITVASGSSGSAKAEPYTNALHLVQSTADVLVFETTGTVRLSAGEIDTAAVNGTRLCVREGGCVCPDVPDDIPPPQATEPPLVAITGGPSGSSVTVTGQSLDLHCQEEAEADEAVRVVYDRPGAVGVLAGRILQVTSCNGPYGDWSGALALGGLALDGFEVPFQELPLDFTVGGSGTQTVATSTSGVVSTPVFDLDVAYDLSVTVDGETMSITGTGRGDTDAFGVGAGFPSQLSSLPILPAPEGSCS